MKATYRNSIKSKHSIRDAVIDLLAQKKDITLISVSEIVKKADINRGTFYNHYSNIIDVINEMEDELIDKLAISLKNLPKTNDIDNFIDTIFLYFQENETVFKKISNCLTKSIIDKLKFRFIERLKKMYIIVDEVMLMFVVNGLAGVYIDYLTDSVNISLDQIKKNGSIIIKTFLINQQSLIEQKNIL